MSQVESIYVARIAQADGPTFKRAVGFLQSQMDGAGAVGQSDNADAAWAVLKQKKRG
jgi:hypothetical protein